MKGNIHDSFVYHFDIHNGDKCIIDTVYLDDIGDCDIIIYKYDSGVPHFHIVNNNLDLGICLFTNDYYNHSNGYSRDLNDIQKKELNDWLNSKPNNKDVFENNWSYIVSCWKKYQRELNNNILFNDKNITKYDYCAIYDSELYISEGHEDTAYTTIGHLNLGRHIGECTIEIYTEDGFPRFHIFNRSRKFRTCISIFSDKYVFYKGEHCNILNSKQIDKLTEWLKEDYIIPGITRLKGIEFIWKTMNERSRFIEYTKDTTNYSIMNNYKYERI